MDTNPVSAADLPVRMAGPWGGSGGGEFRLPTGTQIRRITVRSGAWVDRIEFTYTAVGSTFTRGFGGSGGAATSFDLAPGEYLTRVSGRAGAYIDRIEFLTNRGNSFAAGGTGGTAFSYDLTGKRVQGFFGRAGTYLDQIGLYVGTGVPRGAKIIYAADTDCSDAEYWGGLQKTQLGLLQIMRSFYVELDLENRGKIWDAPVSNSNGDVLSDLASEIPSSAPHDYVLGFTNWMDVNGVAYSPGRHAVVSWDVPIERYDHEEIGLVAHELSHSWGVGTSSPSGHVDQTMVWWQGCLMEYEDLSVMDRTKVEWCPTDRGIVETTMSGWSPRHLLVGAGSGGYDGTYCLGAASFQVEAGKTYEISTCGAFDGDPYVKVTGACACSNDDACGWGSRCTCRAGSTGTATICASTYSYKEAKWDYSVRNLGP